MFSKTYPHHIPSIPYTTPPSKLRTLDIWLPRPLSSSPPSSTIWVIYIHGGAWRDPLQTSACFHPTITHFLNPTTPSPTLERIAGFASLNYRLSPYPSHPTSPSSPSDPDRNVQHPQHLADVITALDFLGKEYGVGRRKAFPSEEEEDEEQGYRYVTVGHSCGATLLCQLLSPSLPAPLAIGEPMAQILVASIYDIPSLLTNHCPPNTSPETAKIYRDIIEGAFGTDEEAWKAASPVGGSYGREEWKEGRVVVVAWSKGDELVEAAQGRGMVGCLRGSGWKREDEEGESERTVLVRELEGGHDFVWEDGRQIVGLIEEVVGRLV